MTLISQARDVERVGWLVWFPGCYCLHSGLIEGLIIRLAFSNKGNHVICGPRKESQPDDKRIADLQGHRRMTSTTLNIVLGGAEFGKRNLTSDNPVRIV